MANSTRQGKRAVRRAQREFLDELRVSSSRGWVEKRSIETSDCQTPVSDIRSHIERSGGSVGYSFHC
jgi:hypothetical protein